MKVTVDKNACIGNGMCIGIVSETFKFGDDGKSEAYNPDSNLLDLIREAEENCPVGAIIIEEDE